MELALYQKVVQTRRFCAHSKSRLIIKVFELRTLGIESLWLLSLLGDSGLRFRTPGRNDCLLLHVSNTLLIVRRSEFNVVEVVELLIGRNVDYWRCCTTDLLLLFVIRCRGSSSVETEFRLLRCASEAL